MSKKKRSRASGWLPQLFAWSFAGIWMGVIYWFSNQASGESTSLSLGVMQLGGRVLDHWPLVGFIGFILVFNLFLIWLSRRSTPLWAKLIFFVLFLVCCAGIIYVLIFIIRPRYGLFGLTSMNRWVLHNFLRKYAHFFIYLFLGMIVKNAFSVSGIKGMRAFLFSLGICALFAVTDEIHQMFVPGRIPLVTDVFIDSAGSFVGIVLYSIMDWLSGNRTIWQAFWNSPNKEKMTSNS